MTENGSFVQIAVFASGAGSNTQNIINYFRDHPFIRIALVICNKPAAGVVSIAEKEKIPLLLIEKDRFFNGDAYLEELLHYSIDFIVLAGFLWKIPLVLIKNYPGKIINIHPALLPKYGGKGMYGINVHDAVIAAKEKESGISIHFVDERFDHGALIFQAKCSVKESDTAETLAQKIHQLEQTHFPKWIEETIVSQIIVKR
jgi:phosphoribosylglycinamide formyltransferase-1